MEGWKKDARLDVVIIYIDALVLANYPLQKIEKVTDYDWLYERLESYTATKWAALEQILRD